MRHDPPPRAREATHEEELLLCQVVHIHKGLSVTLLGSHVWQGAQDDPVVRERHGTAQEQQHVDEVEQIGDVRGDNNTRVLESSHRTHAAECSTVSAGTGGPCGRWEGTHHPCHEHLNAAPWPTHGRAHSASSNRSARTAEGTARENRH